MHDLPNGMVIDGVLQPFAQGEPSAALKHLSWAGDLLVYDRNYASFEVVCEHQQCNMHVLMRLRLSFSQQVKTFAQSAEDDAVVAIRPGENMPVKDKAYGRNTAVQVRLVKSGLDNGQVALLLTTPPGKEEFPVECLKQVYALRRGVETAYDVCSGGSASLALARQPLRRPST
ncbi:hypothetical protein PKOR_14260 [Pontibacter korlensis]|uniref:Transposase IS4-like domain-containing protein n=1 Tax=Pontibacter korlensis TaxID=400092 RepID=A0A0E3ZF20_9BACT|nr:hypothetical protein [Pontibacter korlensis]AKD04045.1 hypothetical protein PKOR_14260 [Pontibacter korlensis]